MKNAVLIFISVACALEAIASPETQLDDEKSVEQTTEEGTAMSPDNWKHKSEWFGLNAGFGNYGFNLSTTTATLRWEHFYWTLLSADWTMSSRTHTFFFHGGFSRFGVPIHLGSSGRHEIRVGLSLEIAAGVQMEVTHGCSGDDTSGDCSPMGEILDLYAAPELSYHFHVLRRFSISAGAIVYFAMVDLFEAYNGERMPPNAIGYIGFSL